MLLKRLILSLTAITLVLFGFMPATQAQIPVYNGYVYAVQNTPQTILSRLMQANGIPTSRIQSIELVKSDTINAATDGRKIQVTTGLWNAMQTDDQRAFVIAHELAHVTLNHVPKTQVRRLGLGILNAFLANRYQSQSGLVELVRQSSIGMVEMKFSRSAEYGADDTGLQIMRNAGYDPNAALQVFEIFQRSTRARGTPEFLRDHPLNESRITALVKKYQLGSTTAAIRSY